MDSSAFIGVSIRVHPCSKGLRPHHSPPMTIRVALHHRTRYQLRPGRCALSPHEVRLRPAAHCRTPIESYSLKVQPAKHFLNWQQDPYGNWLARLVFPEKATLARDRGRPRRRHDGHQPVRLLRRQVGRAVPVRLHARATRASSRPTSRSSRSRRGSRPGSSARARATCGSPITTIDFLVGVNGDLQHDVKYLIRLEPGIQAPGAHARERRGLLPRLRVAAGADPAPLRPGRALRLRLPHPARRRPEAPRRPGRHRQGLHRPARLVRGLRARARAGSGSTPPRACSRARATSRSPARRCPRARRP